MSLKVLLFGQFELIATMVNQLKAPGIRVPSEELIHVDHLTLDETQFILFSLQDRNLTAEQATGTNALLFFLNAESPLYEEKQFLFDLLLQKKQFDSLPIILVFEKQQNLNIKDVINYFELYKVKDRASMIKEINFNQIETITDIFKWVEGQVDFKRSKVFNAQPKVVKMKSKYRESQQEQSVKKYQSMLKDKQFKGLAVKKQEQVYIEKEKQKIKNSNMEKQLANFNKNKKKMSPYDIKPTPNPKIQPNLHFFLKDPKNQKETEVNIKIQTDEFKDRPPEKSYVPKKTGINISTQIETNQLFDFDKEVRPILNILTTKALETAALEIEEEVQFLKIAKYKSTYNDRVKKQKEHEQKNIDEELHLIKEKDKLLLENRIKNQAKKQIKQRILCYEIASNFLSGMVKETCDKIYQANVYSDSFQNELRTNYLDDLLNKSALSFQNISRKHQSIRKVFQQDCIDPLLKAGNQNKKNHEQKKKIKEKRQTNKTINSRCIHVCYNHEHKSYSNFAKYISKGFDGTLDEFVRVKQEEYQEITDKISSGEAGEDNLVKEKLKQNLQFSKNHVGYLINADKQLCFTSTSNRYEKYSNKALINGVLLLDKESQIIDTVFFDEKTSSKVSYLQFAQQLRKPQQVVNFDQGIIINLKAVPQNTKTIILLTKVLNVQSYKAETELKKIKYSSYGLQFYQRNVPIHKKNIGEEVKWEELVKLQEGQEVSQTPQQIFVVSYLLKRRALPQFWNLEEVCYVSKPFINDESKGFIEDLSRLYLKSTEFLKDQEEEEENREKKSSRTGSRAALKSKKIIEEPKKKITFKVSSKILNEKVISLNESLQKIKKILSEDIEEWKQFVDSCENGWQLLIKGKRLQNVQQLLEYKKVGDLQLVKIAKVEEVKPIEVEIIQGKQGEEEES